MEYNENSYYPGQNPGDGQPKRKKPQNRGLWKLLWLVPVILIAAGLAMDSFYTLTEDQYAVITTFGKPTTVSASGLQMKIPLVQRVSLVSKSIQGFPLGYRAGSDESVDDESLMITYDYNFVNVDFYVEYRVTDPVKYLYNSSDPVGILKMLCQSYIRDTIGLYDVDSVITTGKSEIQSEIKQKVMNRLEQEDPVRDRSAQVFQQHADPVDHRFRPADHRLAAAGGMVHRPAAEAEGTDLLQDGHLHAQPDHGLGLRNAVLRPVLG